MKLYKVLILKFYILYYYGDMYNIHFKFALKCVCVYMQLDRKYIYDYIKYIFLIK